MGQLAAVQRARELLMLDRSVAAIVLDLHAGFGVSVDDAIAAVIVGRSLNRESVTTSVHSARSATVAGTRSAPIRSRISDHAPNRDRD